MKKTFKLAIATVFTFCLCLLLIELFLRFFQVAWPPVYQHFFEDKDKFYIYSVGESTAQGVHYSQKISPAILVSYQFNDSLQNKPAEIIQLAQSGKPTEFHYFKYFFEVLLRPHSNALVLVYSGINEGLAKEDIPDNNFTIWKLFQQSIVCSSLCYKFRLANNSPAKFEYRYYQLIQLAKGKHHQIVVSQLVGNIQYDPRVYKDDCLMTDENRNRLHLGQKAFAHKDYHSAENIFADLMSKVHAESPFLIYWMGLCKYEEGQFDSAKLLLSRAPEIDGSIGFSKWKNNIISRVCKKEQVPVAGVLNRFLDSSEHRILGYNLISDAHHPNLEGYCIMADEISREVSRLYGDSIKRSVSPAICASQFKFDSAFYSSVYYSLTEWFINEAFNTQERGIRLKKLKYYMNEYESFQPQNDILPVWKLLVSVLENKQGAFLENFRKVTGSNQSNEMLRRVHDAFKPMPSFREEIKSTIQNWQWSNKEDKKDCAYFIKCLEG